MSLRDLLSPAISTDQRVRTSSPVLRRVFANDLYEVFVGLYPGGLLATLVHYKRESLRIMSHLGDSAGLSQKSSQEPSPANDAWVNAALAMLKASGRGPFHLIRDAKLESKVQLTLHDRAALKLAQIEVPKSAGRYREMFGNGPE